jgi:hypothetical protein
VKAISVLLYRARTGIPFQMTNRREALERAMYTTLNPQKLCAILEQDVSSEVTKIEAVLNEYYGAIYLLELFFKKVLEDVQRIFKYYAACEAGRPSILLSF